MKKQNGELHFRDHILLFLITVLTLILPALLFQPRKNLPAPKVPRKTPVVLADANSYKPDGLRQQLDHHDPKVFLEGDDAHSFARFRLREQDPVYLQKQIGGLPPLLKQETDVIQPGKLPGSDQPAFTAPLFPTVPQQQKTVTVRKDLTYPLLLSYDGTPLHDCKISIGKNTAVPSLPTTFQITIPDLDAIPGFLHAELKNSCGNRNLDMLAQRSINQYLLANSSRNWLNGGTLTVYWQWNIKPAVLPEDSQKEDNQS